MRFLSVGEFCELLLLQQHATAQRGCLGRIWIPYQVQKSFRISKCRSWSIEICRGILGRFEILGLRRRSHQAASEPTTSLDQNCSSTEDDYRKKQNKKTSQDQNITRPDTTLPKSRAGGQGPYLRSLDHLGRSSEVQKKIKKK